MSQTRRVALVLAVVALLGVRSSSHLVNDHSDCADELDRLRRAARDAGDAASAAASAFDDMETKRQRMESECSPPLDRMSCSSARSDYDSAKSDFGSKQSTFKSEYGTTVIRMKSAQSSCDPPADLGDVAGVSKQHQSSCQLLRRMARLSAQLNRPAPTIDACTSLGLSPSECQACLTVRQ